MDKKTLGGYQPTTHEISDAEFQEFLDSHPAGASVQEIATFMGITRERTYQILNKALGKLQRVCRERDISPGDFPSRETTWDRLESF